MSSEELRSADTTKPTTRVIKPTIILTMSTNSRDSERLVQVQTLED